MCHAASLHGKHTGKTGKYDSHHTFNWKKRRNHLEIFFACSFCKSTSIQHIKLNGTGTFTVEMQMLNENKGKWVDNFEIPYQYVHTQSERNATQ